MMVGEEFFLLRLFFKFKLVGWLDWSVKQLIWMDKFLSKKIISNYKSFWGQVTHVKL